MTDSELNEIAKEIKEIKSKLDQIMEALQPKP